MGSWYRRANIVATNSFILKGQQLRLLHSEEKAIGEKALGSSRHEQNHLT